MSAQSFGLPGDDFLLQVHDLRVNLARQLLVQRGRLLGIGGDQSLRNGVLDLTLNERSNSRRERPRDMCRDVGTNEQPLEFGWKVLRSKCEIVRRTQMNNNAYLFHSISETLGNVTTHGALDLSLGDVLERR